MPELHVSTLAAVVQHLPLPVVLTTESGEIVAASHASHPVVGTATPGDSLTRLMADTFPTPRSTRHRIETDGAPHLLVALDSRPLAPPDVAALARSTAHDFNNLLGVIINFASLAASELPAESSAAQDLQEVLVASRRAATLTQRLLQIATAPPD